jgi:hypothetical protein
MEGLGKIRYVNGWAVFAASFILLYLVGAISPMIHNAVQVLSNGIAGTLPASLSAALETDGLVGVLFIAGILTVLLKVLDAPKPHLYTHGAAASERRAFERRYEGAPYHFSKQHADYIYGATVGKVKRERAAKRRRG